MVLINPVGKLSPGRPFIYSHLHLTASNRVIYKTVRERDRSQRYSDKRIKKEGLRPPGAEALSPAPASFVWLRV